jgi:glycosyltransferase involved in cell wall biosynthesis
MISSSYKTLVLPVITWQRTGGLESVTMDIASTFVEMGWRVKVFSVFDPELPKKVPGIDVIKLCPSQRWRRPLWHRFLWKRELAMHVCQALKNGGILLFGHAHLLPLLDYLPQLPMVKKWIWVYGLEVWGGQASRWCHYINQLNHIISISTFTALQVINAGAIVPLDVIPCCIDIHQFTPTPAPEQIRRHEILICGRMSAAERYKGHDILFRCLPLAERLLDMSLTLRIVGSGDDVEYLKTKARQLGLAEKVFFTGRLPLSDLIDSYRHCGVFCMPSQVDRHENTFWSGEGFGIVYIEAAACGRPVIASMDGGAPETIIPGESGLLVDPRSVESIVQGIVYIMSDPIRADSMGRQGRHMVEEKFSREKFKKNLDELVKRYFL